MKQLTPVAATGPSVRIRIVGKGESCEFDCAPGERILHAGLRGGIDLPYECASGTCGTCKATLVEGDTNDAWPLAPGKKYLKADKGEILMCQSVARSDCELKIFKRVAQAPVDRVSPRLVAGTLLRPRALAPGVIEFEVLLAEPLTFAAGQFVLVRFPGIAGARSYSMVNFARDTRILQFVVKRFPGGSVSEWLFGSATAATEATEVEIFGPLGHATFEPAIAKHVVCIAGGSGIAGMMAILAHGWGSGHFRAYDGRVFFGVRTPADVFYLDELARLAHDCAGRLRVTIVLSHEAASEDVERSYPELVFDTGFVHEAAKRALENDVVVQDTMAYVAGPPPMVDATLRMLLLELRFPGPNIRYDKFS